jgi:hypothetical protein
MPRWIRILVWCGLGVLSLCLYISVFGVQTALAVWVRYLGWKHPVLWKAPIELTDDTISKSGGRKLSYLGCEFEVPWDDLDERDTKLVGTWEVIRFKSGRSIVLMKHEPGDPLRDFLNTEKRLGMPIGEESPDYDGIRLVLDTVPGSVKPFSSRQQALRAWLPLVLKDVFMMDGETGVFLIHTPRFRGFQYGDPANNPYRIRDDLYSSDSDVGLVFIPVKTSSISQSEINRVIQTFSSSPASTQTRGSETPSTRPSSR